jgi:hypothetical protein
VIGGPVQEFSTTVQEVTILEAIFLEDDQLESGSSVVHDGQISKARLSRMDGYLEPEKRFHDNIKLCWHMNSQSGSDLQPNSTMLGPHRENSACFLH